LTEVCQKKKYNSEDCNQNIVMC